MKHLSLGALVATPLLMVGPMVQQGGGSDDVQAALTAQTQRIDDLERDLTEARDLLDLVLGHMQTQADAAKDLEASLRSSKELGFTAGINPKSREVLLSGWHSYLGSQQGALPKRKGAKGKE